MHAEHVPQASRTRLTTNPKEVCYSPQHTQRHRTHTNPNRLPPPVHQHTPVHPDGHCQPSKAFGLHNLQTQAQRTTCTQLQLVVTAAASVKSRQFRPTPTTLAHQQWPMSKPHHTSARPQPVGEASGWSPGLSADKPTMLTHFQQCSAASRVNVTKPGEASPELHRRRHCCSTSACWAVHRGVSCACAPAADRGCRRLMGGQIQLTLQAHSTGGDGVQQGHDVAGTGGHQVGDSTVVHAG